MFTWAASMAARQQISFRLEDYDYDLPPVLIAQHPSTERDRSRLLVLDRLSGAIEHSCFDRIEQYLRPGDLLVVNDTRVVPARLTGRKHTGGMVELLVLDAYKPCEVGAVEGYCCLTRASKGIRKGQVIELSEGVCAEVIAAPVDGKAQVCFHGASHIVDILDRIGQTPLPPYIERNSGQAADDDRVCYQTEYAANPGAVAAPTAGLHFTKSLLNRLGDSGIQIAALTLHVGYGTFSPIRCADIREHRMHPEFIEIGKQTAEAVNRAKREQRRVVAVGTTVVRTLEWLYEKDGEIAPFQGMCEHYIYPGRRFAVVDCMVTNFHLPRSSLMLLVSAFAGRPLILSAYRDAVLERYRFFSYGDAMLIM
ncbi:S-adenosylmethionine:tRNA ribosyltransferase-isomerase [Syntrophobacter sp. SbD1]|nr:S-adenosylmethionine:tRNA ribosyltransferase-isomerase [Syntrophobacter sp. SbD1]